MALRIWNTFGCFASFHVQRQDLLAGIVELLGTFVQITNFSNDALTQLLFYGDQDLSYDLIKNIL